MSKQQNIRSSEINQAIEWAARGQLAVIVAYRLARAAGYPDCFETFIRQAGAQRKALRQAVQR